MMYNEAEVAALLQEHERKIAEALGISHETLRRAMALHPEANLREPVSESRPK